MLEILIKMWYTFFEVVVMIHSIQSCAFSGHRPKSFSFGYDETSVDFQLLRSKMKNTIIQVCNAGCRAFYCGMAEGVDLWCGEIVLELKETYEPSLEIFPVVPYFSQPDSMCPANKDRYRRIMEAAKERFLVSRAYNKSCFQRRNRFMVDSCDALIAVIREDHLWSGTAQTVRYAEKRNKQVFYIHP